jgi:hypothetical protein
MVWPDGVREGKAGKVRCGLVRLGWIRWGEAGTTCHG